MNLFIDYVLIKTLCSTVDCVKKEHNLNDNEIYVT